MTDWVPAVAPESEPRLLIIGEVVIPFPRIRDAYDLWRIAAFGRLIVSLEGGLELADAESLAREYLRKHPQLSAAADDALDERIEGKISVNRSRQSIVMRIRGYDL